jgi:hypothetical protein
MFQVDIRIHVVYWDWWGYLEFPLHGVYMWFRKCLNQKYLSDWKDTSESLKDGKLTTYLFLKTNFKLEEYLTLVKKYEYRKSIYKLRTSAHRLFISPTKFWTSSEKVSFIFNFLICTIFTYSFISGYIGIGVCTSFYKKSMSGCAQFTNGFSIFIFFH